ncbi:MAG: hypothetical protein AAF371_02595 [Pseudomonadota bacterium]
MKKLKAGLAALARLPRDVGRVAATYSAPPPAGGAQKGSALETAAQAFRSALEAEGPDLSKRRLRALVRSAAAAVPADQAPSLLRTLPEAVQGRGLAARVAELAARLDPEFLAHVAVGDAARDAADWGHAASAYAAALDLFPFHPGYWVQLGHMRKELRQFAGAEAAYRSARALGSAEAALAPHLAYVCGETGCEPGQRPAAAGPLPLDEPPLEPEARALWHLFTDSPCSDEKIAELLRIALKRSLIERLIAEPRFPERKRGLSALLVETGGL